MLSLFGRQPGMWKILRLMVEDREGKLFEGSSLTGGSLSSTSFHLQFIWSTLLK